MRKNVFKHWKRVFSCYVRSLRYPSGRLGLRSLKLIHHNFSVLYKFKKKHHDADSLSRSPLLVDVSVREQKRMTKTVALINSVDVEAQKRSGVPCSPLLSTWTARQPMRLDESENEHHYLHKWNHLPKKLWTGRPLTLAGGATRVKKCYTVKQRRSHSA